MPQNQQEITSSKPSKSKSLMKITGLLLKLSLGVAITVVCVYFAGSGSTLVTDITEQGVLQQKISVDGFIVRDEAVVDSPINGVVQTHVAYNTRVPIGSKLATVYDSGISDSLLAKLKNVEDRISYYSDASIAKEYIFSESYQVDTKIQDLISDLADEISGRNIDAIDTKLEEIDLLINQKAYIEGRAEINRSSEILNQLYREKQQLTAAIGVNISNFDVYTPTPGLFVKHLDGLEGKLTLDYVLNSQIANLSTQAIHAIPPGKTEGIGKVVDNFVWYYCFVIDKKHIEGLNVGSRLGITIPATGEEITGTVSHILVDGDKSLVAISCRSSFNGCYEMRFLTADVVFKSYSGFKIPLNAIRVAEDGSKSVFVVSDHIAYQRDVQLIYNDKQYAVVKRTETFDPSYQKSLKLYDEVIVAGQNISHGKVVR